MKQKFVVGLMVFMLLVGIQVRGAQAQPPVVYTVLFFSPSCGHCHYVITEFLPPLQAEYGEQLQVLYIDVSQPAGRTLFQAACEAFDVSADRCGYVPTLVIGDTVLVGSGDIPEQMPSLVRDGVTAGGIDLPLIPGLREAYEASVSDQQASDTQNAPSRISPNKHNLSGNDMARSAESGSTWEWAGDWCFGYFITRTPGSNGIRCTFANQWKSPSKNWQSWLVGQPGVSHNDNCHRGNTGARK